MSETIEISEDELEAIVDEKVEQRLEEERTQVSRRSVIGALAGAAGVGALGWGAGSAAADPANASGTVYFDQIGDSNYPVTELHVDKQINYNTDETFDNITVNSTADLTDVLADTLLGADVSSNAVAERALETDGNGNLQPVTAVTDGDGTKREIWVIANGASDPAGADTEDIILEEQA